MARRVVLDCDTGTDDAIAIMLAALHPDLELLGVTTVHGNHPVADTTEHTLRVLDHIGHAHVGVYAGAGAAYARREAPLDPRMLPPLALPPATSSARPTPAAEWLTTIDAPFTVVATGPLTNVAHALDLDPGLTERVEELVFLGSTDVPSVTPLAERNVWNDPVAVQRVLEAGFRRLTIVPLDATYRTQVGSADADALQALGTPAATATARFVRERIAQYAHERTEAPVHDALAVATLLDPDVVTLREASARVELVKGERYGRTDFDLGGTGVRLAVDADRARFVGLLLATLCR
jgi:inosine-uridine nucleoside N-ribohydrolase